MPTENSRKRLKSKTRAYYLKENQSTYVEYKKFNHLHRDAIKKIIKIGDQIAAIGTKGSVGILNREQDLVSAYDLDLEDKSNCVTVGKRHDAWRHLVTDAVEMRDCQFFAVATSRKNIHFIDISDETHLEGYRLLGLPYAPLCLEYWYNKSQDGKSLLFIGDSGGHVHMLTFHQPKTGLFEGKRLAGVERLQFQHLETSHVRCVRHNRLPASHPSGVKRIKYLSCNQTLISCSSDETCSVLIQQVHNKLPLYKIQLTGGVYDLDYDENRRIIATCGRRCEAQLWNVTTCLIGCLYGHATPIISIKFHQRGLVTLACDQELRFWDVKSESCVHRVFLHFQNPFRSHLEEGHAPHPLMDDDNKIWIVSGLFAASVRFTVARVSCTRNHLHKEDTLTSSQNTLFPIGWSVSTDFVTSTISSRSNDMTNAEVNFQNKLTTSKQRAIARLNALVRHNRPYTALPTHHISPDWKIRKNVVI